MQDTTRKLMEKLDKLEKKKREDKGNTTETKKINEGETRTFQFPTGVCLEIY